MRMNALSTGGAKPSALTIVLVLYALIACAFPGSSHAAAACSYDGGTDTVTITVSNQFLEVSVQGGGIFTGSSDGSGGAQCGTATVANTELVVISGSAGDESVDLDIRGGDFAPGTTAEGVGTSEIEFAVDLVSGSDAVSLSAIAGNHSMVVGQDGSGNAVINLNGDNDGDITVDNSGYPPSSWAAILLSNESGTNTMSCAGDASTGAVADFPCSFYGGTGVDTISGGNNSDSISAGAGADIINAGDGSDYSINPGTGADSVVCGDGDDVVYETGDAGNADADTYVGGAGSDTISYDQRTQAVWVSTDGVADDGAFTGSNEQDNVDAGFERIFSGSGSDTLSISGLASAGLISGGDGNDVITGGNSDDSLAGGLGADTINGGTGSDVIEGNQGSDTLNGNAGDDFLTPDHADAGASADVVDGGADTDRLLYSNVTVGVTINLSSGQATPAGGAADTLSALEEVVGSGQQDAITGSAASEVLIAGDGDDTITPGGGNDNVTGNGGNDICIASALGDGNDVFDGGGGTNVMSYAVRTSGQPITFQSSMGTTGGGDGETDQLVNVAQINGGEGNDVLEGYSVFNGNGGNDTISNATSVSGGNGNDAISATLGDDDIDAGAGNDTIVETDTGAAESSDSFTGGSGVDHISYAARTNSGVRIIQDGVANDGKTGENDNVTGFERITTGDGADNISGTSGADVIVTGNGADIVSGGGGSDTITTGSGIDQITGGTGNDTINAGDDADVVSGGAGNDTIRGGNNPDRLTGDAGNDRMEGGAGNDRLTGGRGRDSLFGNAGFDRFQARDGQRDIVRGGTGRDSATVDARDSVRTVEVRR